MNKSEMMVKLEELGIILLPKLPTIERKLKSIDPRYQRLKYIRVNPIRVTVRDLQTDEIKTYHSLYKASKDIRRSAHYIAVNDGRVVNNRYEITMGDSPTKEAPLVAQRALAEEGETV